eukprot:COSAG01_NODE_492_length_16335_cov_63.722284_10_plen_212_part_00
MALQGSAALAGRSARAQLPSSAIGRSPTRHRRRRPRQMAVAVGFRAGGRCAGRFHPLMRSILTEIHLCDACSCHASVREEAPLAAAGQQVSPRSNGGGGDEDDDDDDPAIAAEQGVAAVPVATDLSPSLANFKVLQLQLEVGVRLRCCHRPPRSHRCQPPPVMAWALARRWRAGRPRARAWRAGDGRPEVPPPRHVYPDRIPDLTKISLRF